MIHDCTKVVSTGNGCLVMLGWLDKLLGDKDELVDGDKAMGRNFPCPTRADFNVFICIC